MKLAGQGSLHRHGRYEYLVTYQALDVIGDDYRVVVPSVNDEPFELCDTVYGESSKLIYVWRRELPEREPPLATNPQVGTRPQAPRGAPALYGVLDQVRDACLAAQTTGHVGNPQQVIDAVSALVMELDVRRAMAESERRIVDTSAKKIAQLNNLVDQQADEIAGLRRWHTDQLGRIQQWCRDVRRLCDNQHAATRSTVARQVLGQVIVAFDALADMVGDLADQDAEGL